LIVSFTTFLTTFFTSGFFDTGFLIIVLVAFDCNEIGLDFIIFLSQMCSEIFL
jgi:hypothetical protein